MAETKISTRLRTWLPVIIGCVVVIVAAIYSTSVASNRQANLDSLDSQIASVKSRISVLETTANDEAASAVYIASGIDSARQAIDDAVVEEFLQIVFEWDSLATYNEARELVMSTYGLSEDDTFMTVFMPYVASAEINGVEINDIDTNGLNMSYSEIESYVTNISGDYYTYFTLVTVESSDSNGATADGTSVFIYTVDANGNLSNLSAYAA